MLPFEDSRRLMGANLFFASTGAVLDTLGIEADAALIAAWRSRIDRARAQLGWPERHAVARRHARGVSLALAAPADRLFLATEVNEWALCAALAQRDPSCRSELEAALLAQALEAAQNGANTTAMIPPAIEESAAMSRFQQLERAETKPQLLALLAAAAARGLQCIVDETDLTLGAGCGARSFALTALPLASQVPWDEVLDIPTALVTGSNGKTTTVRLLAAFAQAHGWHAGYNCTDGVFLDGEPLATGDYSGPAGARMVLREPRAQAAILETARGGILRRGIAVSQADVAIVTNVSSDHFGEYGIDDLAGLAQVKLVVAAAVKPVGLLVLNAADAQLCAAAAGIASRFGRSPPLGWFDAGEDPARLEAYRARGAATCGVSAGRLIANHGGAQHDLGSIDAMPLSVNSVAAYNVANIAAAALAGIALGIAPASIAGVLARFGADPGDNAGRLMRFERRGVTVLVDYAHNPDGLNGFLRVADHLRGGGRLAVMLGHAGNRQDEDIEALAAVAAGFRPDLVIIKENESHLRGRAPGEIPRIIRAALRRLGLPEAAMQERSSELEAARCALDWARPGDVLALPVHAMSARAAVVKMLQEP